MNENKEVDKERKIDPGVDAIETGRGSGKGGREAATSVATMRPSRRPSRWAEGRGAIQA